MSTTARTNRPLPGHMIISLILAFIVWAIGVILTARSLPIGDELGPAIPVGAAIMLQLLFTLGQSNVRMLGLDSSRWPFIVMIVIDVVLNWAGLLVAFVPGVASLSDAALYVLLAISTGAGLWQCLIAFLVGALIAASPESMIKDALRG